jgi:UDP-hydrolysing UDP-N-acetyl-D-glucosamine 2-epimerase
MKAPRRIAVITGCRAEFGLLRPVMVAIRDRGDLQLQVIVTGTHLLPPANTGDEVRSEFDVAATIPMQRPGETGRAADAAAAGRGLSGMAAWLDIAKPDVALVLGDRIEAFAAAVAASIAGIRVAHMHGGDRAEGIADEAIRHAITKLAHIHLPATKLSAQRIIAMGETPQRVHVVGSPALDGLGNTPPLEDDVFRALGQPRIVILLHPTGGSDDEEHRRAATLLQAATSFGSVLALHPNHDAGRAGIMRAIEDSGMAQRDHLPRRTFIGLLRRAGVLAGNSSAGLIEAAALGVRCVNIGGRQNGRERAGNVIDVPEWSAQAIARAMAHALRLPPQSFAHPFGDGRAGELAAAVLATFDPAVHALAKRNSY